ncbi:VOC family protein [Streptomyces sp. NPDC050504]|uniref:VOC family protein n=1 Tax=Streptomyces sp. NPDC050504 TaxID=3365618 RepID=UPI0037A121AF
MAPQTEHSELPVFTESTPCWVDVTLPDLAAGKRFYGELFGWSFADEVNEPHARFADALSGGRRVAALAAKRDGRMPTAWGVYFATSDAGAAAARVQEAGGQVVTAPLPVGGAGVMAQCADPGGAVFGLWQAGERTGFEKWREPGSFCWAEVYVRDKASADPFYEEVFGFQGTDLPPDELGVGVDFRMWSPAGTDPGPDSAVGGRSVFDDAFPLEMPGHFLVYFAVDDCDAAVASAVRLGGRVTTPPFDIPYGRAAVLHDDQGASFAVLAEPRS